MEEVMDTAGQRIAYACSLADDLRSESDNWMDELKLVSALEVIGAALIAIAINLERSPLSKQRTSRFP